MSRVLVTGGAGFLGRVLVERLVADGVDVVVLDNLSSASPLPLPDRARLVEGDVIDPPPLGGPFDRIFHLASPASPPRFMARPVETLRAGAEGTRRMLELAEGTGTRFLLASTSEVYGDPEEHPQKEDYRGAVAVTSLRAPYDEAKRYAEALVYAFRRAGRVPDSRVARIFNTYGPGMDPSDGRVVSNFVVQALKGEPLTVYGEGTQTRSFCYVDDLVDGLLRLMESDYEDPVNLGMPAEMTVLELADMVAQVVADTGIRHVELPDADPARRCPDISRARSVLSWEPTTRLREGLELTVDYFRSLM
ncbi:MAG: NAD-dependent epimerase/dehydratase family protein [Acidimicrobiia bacterium]